jgi:hypothetical protein
VDSRRMLARYTCAIKKLLSKAKACEGQKQRSAKVQICSCPSQALLFFLSHLIQWLDHPPAQPGVTKHCFLE